MPDYKKNKTLFASYKNTSSSEYTFVARNFETMKSHPSVKDNFDRAMDFFFNEISQEDEKRMQYQVKPYKGSDSQVIIEAINVGRRYMRTLIETDKFADPHEEGSTGLLRIRVDILEDRLYQIGQLIGYITEARQLGNDSQLVIKLPAIYSKIQYGVIPSSAMRRSMESFFERVNRLSVDKFSGCTYDDCLLDRAKAENKEVYLCNILHQTMKEPVYIEADRCWYEQNAIKKWLIDHNNMSPNRNRINPDDLHVDREHQKRIKNLDKNTPVPESLRESHTEQSQQFSPS